MPHPFIPQQLPPINLYCMAKLVHVVSMMKLIIAETIITTKTSRIAAVNIISVPLERQ